MCPWLFVCVSVVDQMISGDFGSVVVCVYMCVCSCVYVCVCDQMMGVDF